MDKNKLTATTTALRGSAKGIASAMDEELITSDEVYCVLLAIADRYDAIIQATRPKKQPAQPPNAH